MKHNILLRSFMKPSIFPLHIISSHKLYTQALVRFGNCWASQLPLHFWWGAWLKQLLTHLCEPLLSKAERTFLIHITVCNHQNNQQSFTQKLSFTDKMIIYLQIRSTPEGDFETMAHSWDIMSIQWQENSTLCWQSTQNQLQNTADTEWCCHRDVELHWLVTEVNTKVTQSRAVHQKQVVDSRNTKEDKLHRGAWRETSYTF